MTGGTDTSSPLPSAAEAFEALLAFLCPDPSEDRPAAYARIRAKLEDVFRWRGCADPEGLADETLDRVAKKAAEGVRPEKSPTAYVLGVARLVALEAGRRDARHRPPPEQLEAPAPDHEAEVHARALDACLATLSPEDRALLLEYHRGDGRGRIDGRRELAERLGMPIATLRVRAYRIRARVEGCVKKHLSCDMDPG